jgi:dTDP-4-amino-4,6-dideoxygalactose transaminase
MITPNTTGIIGVHLWGRPCDVTALQEIARRNQLKLLFDAAHAFGTSYNGQMIGGFGDAEVFSFHATKIFNTFEGGAVATNDDSLADKIRLMQNFGFVGKDKVIYIGTNGKMNEVSAAMGLTSLDSLESFKNINHRNYNHYAEHLKGIPGVSLLPYNEHEQNNHQYIVLEINEKVTGISRDRIMRILHDENVIARRYFYPGCHRMEPYRSYQPHAGLLLPNTERILQQVLTMPTGSAIDEKQIETIARIIKFVIGHAAEIRIKWPLSVEGPVSETADISETVEYTAV